MVHNNISFGTASPLFLSLCDMVTGDHVYRMMVIGRPGFHQDTTPTYITEQQPTIE